MRRARTSGTPPCSHALLKPRSNYHLNNTSLFGFLGGFAPAGLPTSLALVLWMLCACPVAI